MKEYRGEPKEDIPRPRTAEELRAASLILEAARKKKFSNEPEQNRVW